MKGWLTGIFVLGLSPFAPAQEQGGNVEELVNREMLRNYMRDLGGAPHLTLPGELLQEQEQRVTIDVRDAKLPDILEQFHRQVGIEFTLDPANIDVDEEAYDLRQRDVAWREALAEFLRAADLYIVSESATLIRLARQVKVTYSFSNTDVQQVIEIIAKMANANVIVHPDVKGPITLTVRDAPWEAVLEQVVRTAGEFVIVREDFNILRIIPRNFRDIQLETRMYQLRYLQPPAIYRGKIDTRQATTLEGKPFTAPVDVTKWIESFPLMTIVRSALTRDSSGTSIGTFQYDPYSNVLVVNDTKPVLDKIGEIITALDVEPDSVLIDVKFIITQNRSLFNFGLQWAETSPSDADDFDAGAFGTATSQIGQAVTNQQLNQLPFGLAGGRRWLNQFDVRAILRLFERDGFSRILQQPQISAVDNMEATISVARQYRFVDVQTTATQGVTTTTATESSNSPVEEGFQLLIIPKIVRDSDTLMVTVIPILSELAERRALSFGAGSSIELPELRRTMAVTRLVLKSGTTAMLGGMVQDRQIVVDDGLPVLRNIPLLGWLFKQRHMRDERTHLLIMITPQVVRGMGAVERLDAGTREHLLREMDTYQRMRVDAGLEGVEEQLRQSRERERVRYEDLLRGPAPETPATPAPENP